MMRFSRKVCAAVLSLAMMVTMVPGIQARAGKTFSNIDVSLDEKTLTQKATLTMDTFEYKSYTDAVIVMSEAPKDGSPWDHYDLMEQGYDVCYNYNTHVESFEPITTEGGYYDGSITLPVPEGYIASSAKRIYMYSMGSENLTVTDKIPVIASTATTITIPITLNNNIYYDNVEDKYSTYFSNELCVEFQKAIDISTLKPTISATSYDYTGQPIKPEVTITGLKKDVDYTVEYMDNVNPGTATITITGKGKYIGTTKLTFTIVDPAIDISTLEFKLSDTSFEYTGAAITPDVTCTGLTKDTDFTVAYSNNVNPGTAKATITGIGKYKGTVTLEFSIKEPKKEEDKSKENQQIKAGEKIKDEKTAADYKIISANPGDVKVEYEKSEQTDAKKINVPDNVTLPDGTVAKVTSIAPGAFSGNQSVTGITVGNNVESIGDNAFSDCPNLKNLTIGKNVKNIGAKACKGCPKLKKVTIKSKKLKKVGKNAFKLKKGALIKVPKKQKKAYEKLFKKSKLPTGVKVK